jgi:hypothetical protein
MWLQFVSESPRIAAYYFMTVLLFKLLKYLLGIFSYTLIGEATFDKRHFMPL